MADLRAHNMKRHADLPLMMERRPPLRADFISAHGLIER